MVRILVMPANEELMIARDALKVAKKYLKGERENEALHI